MAANLRLWTFLTGLAGALLMLFLLAPWANGTVREEVDQSAGVAPHVAGELLVIYETGTDAAAAEQLPAETKGEVEEEIPEIDTQVIEFSEVKDEPTEQEREQLLQQKKRALEKDPAVRSVSYNFIYRAAYTPNDEKFGRQYGLKRIEAPLAWSETRGGGVDIAVVDTGISNSHPDLRAKIAKQRNFVGPTDTPSAEDDNGHGTQVAGVAAASTNNGEGIAGACPGCRLLIAKSLDASNTGSADDIAEGITWASKNGAEVINLSLAAEEVDDPVLKRAITRAQRKGAVVVAAAGNYGRNSGTVYPAAYGGVIAVAATGKDNRRYSRSSVGDWVDVAAPGVSILSTKRPTRYGGASGTSFSSPFVAGVAGLLVAQGRPADETRRRIIFSARDLGARGRDKEYGRGLVDAAAAFGVRNTRPQIRGPRPAPGSKTKDRTPRITAVVRDRETDLRKTDLTVILDGKRIPFKYNVSRNRFSYTPGRKLAPGKHSVKVVVRDAQGLRTSTRWVFTAGRRSPQNNSPLSMIDEPGYPFNILPEDPIFDRFKK